MITVLASIHVREGRLDDYLEILKENVPEVCAEDGCISYEPMVDIDSKLPPQVMDANIVTIVEQWESLDALKIHLAAPHMLKYQDKVKGIVEKVSLKVLQNA
ncbi:MAG: putative quinol monooxygenase [Victivallales bacterium]|nr:putative quinol monooxygenase [Victivallales bacterium]